MQDVATVPFFTPGVKFLAVLAVGAICVLAVRFIWGLGAVTNLNDQYPWGLWIGIDVATGVALAAGGFTTAFVAHVMNREQFEPLVRPALLTAALGYTFVGLGVCVDLGRYYNIWHFFVPDMVNGNSALYEVGLCVCLYLTVLYIEFLPIVCERFVGRVNLPGGLAALNGVVDRMLRVLQASLNKVITVFILLGVTLSCAHQSSLGTLMALAPTKLHPLWHSAVLPLQFLLSAFAVGLAMATFESILASRAFKREIEMPILRRLARFIPMLLTLYLAAKVIDMANRGTYAYLNDFSLQSISWLVEVVLGVIVPLLMLLTHRVRRDPRGLFTAAMMIVLGVALNRINVFIIGYKPLYAEGPYIPAWTEILLTAGFISILVLLYRGACWIFPVLPKEEEGGSHA
ncbi:Ni/Fe-hydrogenase cytochrome b subunit [bacterium]|nr:MAG: Ni/Fe-hydrogenase cytochrome b subunit [bacterium]